MIKLFFLTHLSWLETGNRPESWRWTAHNDRSNGPPTSYETRLVRYALPAHPRAHSGTVHNIDSHSLIIQ